MDSITYADIFRPFGKTKAVCYDFALIISSSLIIGLCAQIAVSIGPVPFTFQTFAVLMIAAMLGPHRATLSVIAYIMEGLLGLPVFAMGRSGPAVLFGPTGGYLIGFLFAAFIVGTLAQRGWDRKIWKTILAMLAGNITIHVFGLSWLSVLIGFKNALVSGCYPFIAGDILKIALAAVILPSGWKFIKKLGFPG